MFEYRYPLLEVMQAIDELQERRGRTNKEICDFVRKQGRNPNDPMKVLKTISCLNKLVEEGVLIKKGRRYMFPTKCAEQNMDEQDDSYSADGEQDCDEDDEDDDDDCEDDEECETTEDDSDDDNENQDEDEDEEEEEDDDDDSCNEKVQSITSEEPKPDEEVCQEEGSENQADNRTNDKENSVGDNNSENENYNQEETDGKGTNGKGGNGRTTNRRNTAAKNCTGIAERKNLKGRATGRRSRGKATTEKKTSKGRAKLTTDTIAYCGQDMLGSQRVRPSRGMTQKVDLTDDNAMDERSSRVPKRRRDIGSKRTRLNNNVRSRSPIKKNKPESYSLRIDNSIEMSSDNQLYEEPMDGEMDVDFERDDDIGGEFEDYKDYKGRCGSGPSPSNTSHPDRKESCCSVLEKKSPENIKMEPVDDEFNINYSLKKSIDSEPSLMKTSAVQNKKRDNNDRIKDKSHKREKSPGMVKGKEEGGESFCSLCDKKKRNS